MPYRFFCLCLGAAAVMVSALGRGTVILSNDFIPQGEQTKAFITYAGKPVPAAVGRARVLRASDSTLISAGKDGTGIPFFADGLFSSGVLEVEAYNNLTTTVVIQAWDASTGDTYDTAISRGSRMVVGVGLGGAGEPPATLEKNSNFSGFDIYPWWGSFPPAPAKNITMVLLADGRWRIRATGSGNYYFLYTSPDLLQWTSWGDAYSGQGPLEWIVPAPGPSAGFFQIIP
jgi:hypothetical protein